MKHDNSKTIKLSNEHIRRLDEMGNKYAMNDSEVVRLGIDMLHHFDKKNELMRIVQMILEKPVGEKEG